MSLWGFTRVTLLRSEWKLLSVSLCKPNHFHLGVWLFPLYARRENWIYKYRMEACRDQEKSWEACGLKVCLNGRKDSAHPCVCLGVPQMSLFGGYSPFGQISPDTRIVAPYVRNNPCNISKTVCPTDPNPPAKTNTPLMNQHSFILVGRGAPQGHWLKPHLEQMWFGILLVKLQVVFRKTTMLTYSGEVQVLIHLIPPKFNGHF